MAHNDKEVFTSPAGRLIFVNLTKPRQYKNKGEYAYDTHLVLTDEAFNAKGPNGAPSLHERIVAWAAASVEKHKLEPRELPIQPLMEKVGDVRQPVAGFTCVKFKVDAQTKTRKGEIWERKPKLFDRFGHPITNLGDVPAGTLARIKFTVWFTSGGDKAGVKLQPVSVQIITMPDNTETFEAYEGGESDEQGFGSAPEVTAEAGAKPAGDF